MEDLVPSYTCNDLCAEEEASKDQDCQIASLSLTEA